MNSRFRILAESPDLRVRTLIVFVLLAALLAARITIAFLDPPERWESLLSSLLEASFVVALILLLGEVFLASSELRISERLFEKTSSPWVSYSSSAAFERLPFWALPHNEVVFRRLTGQEDLNLFLIALSLGWDMQVIPMHRFIPVRLYFSDDVDEKETQDLRSSLSGYLKGLGFEIANEAPAEYGSWFKRLVAKSKEALTQDEVLERLRKAERALELATLQIKQSEVDRNQAEAASKLLEAIADASEAVCQIGSILVVKHRGPDGKNRVFTRSLTAAEMIYLESHQELLKSPERILESISKGMTDRRLVSEAAG